MNKKELLDKWLELKPKITPIIFKKLNTHTIAIKDESKNSTGTYKAKHGWMMGLDYLTNYYPQSFTYYLGSTGNAAIADFAYADLLNKLLQSKKVTVVCFYPKHYDEKTLGPDSQGQYSTGLAVRKKLEAYTSGVTLQVDFKEKYWFDNFETGYTPCLDLMNKKGLSTTKTNSKDITEGFNPTYKQVMEEFTEQIQNKFGRMPKTLAVVQFGAGMLYDDTKIVVQEKNLSIDLLAVSTGNVNTIADKICDTSESWQKSLIDLKRKGHTYAKTSGDIIHHVTEKEIYEGLKICKNLNISAEPSGAASLGILERIEEITNTNYELIAVINTGNGIAE
jgi:threonine synthase